MADHEKILGLREKAAAASEPKRRLGPSQRGKKRPAAALTEDEKSNEVVKAEAKADKARVLAESRKKLLIGIDLGTTNSGVSHVQSTGEPKDVGTIKNWTGGYNDLCSKVPSVMAYASENEHLEEDQWGYGVKPGDTCCQWWKLLLDGSTRPTGFDDPLLHQSVGEGLMRLPEGKTAQDVASDFLGHLYRHTMQTLETLIGKEAVNQTPMLFQCTVPAKWSYAAREATRQAAQRAGIGSRHRDEMVMIEEPEAGAIAAISETLATFDNNPFKKNTCIIVVDGGGGTVDLTAYKLRTEEPLRLEEACVGEGGKMGGTTIDRNLHAFLEKRFGKAFTTLSLKKRGGKSAFMTVFEQCKREFSGKRNQTFELPLKMKILSEAEGYVAGYDFEEDQVLITSDEMAGFFAPVLRNIQSLIKRQINGVKAAQMPSVKTIVLVGGLGSSRYVYAQLAKWIEEQLKGKMELVTPERPWSAISEGAAIRGLGKCPVEWRRSRDWIGIMLHKSFDENEHDEADAYICPDTGKRARNQMEWQVERGEKIKENMKKKIACFATVPKDEEAGNAIIHQDIYSCTAEEGPTSFGDTVVKMGTIVVDLSAIVSKERKRLKAGTRPMPAFQKIDVDVELTVGSDKGVLLVNAKVGLCKVSKTVSIEYVADPAWKGTLTVGEH